MAGVDDSRLLTLVGCIRGLVLELDPDGRYVNAWADDPSLLARPAEQLVGHTIDEVLGDAGLPFTAMVRRVCATGVMEHIEYPLDLPGGPRWFLADIKRVSTPETGCTAVFFARDITDRKRAEEALALSEERFRLASLATNDVLWDWDLVTDVVTWNFAVTSLLGYRQPGNTGAWWKEHVHPDDRAKVVDSIAAAIASHETAWSGRYRFRRADGTYADFVDRGFITRDDSGRALRMVGSMADVTRINVLQAQLLQADRLAAIGTLAAGVGHEINNPLCYMIANLEATLAALDAHELPERELLADALEGARRIATTVKSLKTFTRSDADEMRTVDIHEILDAAIELADKQIRHRARLVRTFTAVPRVRASGSQLGQVFLNLLIRAAQAIPDGHADQHEIAITTGSDGLGRVTITIEDTGAGIAPEDVPHIFDPFFGTTGFGPGTGLGLASSHGIVEKHGGAIRVAPRPIGTAFTIELPAMPAVTADALPRVMVIDDEAMIGRVITRMLRSKAEVVALTRAREALERLLAADRVDLVLCDVMMPEMTGIELYDELARHKPELLRKVVFMTGGAFTPRAEQFLESIGSARVDKPLDRARLMALLPA